MTPIHVIAESSLYRGRASTPAPDAPRLVRAGRLAPDLLRGLDDQAELRPLLVLRQLVALDRRGEAALRGQAELLERRVLRRLLDATLQLVLRLELAALRRHEAEHDLLLALRQEAERLEA